MQGEIRGGVKRTFKRSKTAEERAERIKDRNRRAQKARCLLPGLSTFSVKQNLAFYVLLFLLL